jgi:hypothetical protein
MMVVRAATRAMKLEERMKKATQRYPDQYSGTKIPRLRVRVEKGSHPESASAKRLGKSHSKRLKRRK